MKMTQALRTERIERLLKLLAIPGTSGEERAVSDHVRAELLAAGAKSEWITEDRAGDKTPVRSGVGNLICRFPGSTTGPTRLLMAHSSTRFRFAWVASRSRRERGSNLGTRRLAWGPTTARAAP
ncbi:MAG: hypothetical protein R3B96_21905 [Pirellulaceae bacterium]